MSRHKNVRNLDIDAELGDYDADGYDDDGHNGMSETEEKQMRQGVQSVRETLGDDIPGLTDYDIEESLWYYYFDVPKTVNYILSTHNKSQKPAKKKANKDLGTPQSYGTLKMTAVDLGYFLDAPWGNIPEERKGHFTYQTLDCRGGLLGGAPAPASGKVSKLAALAKTRKEKKQAQGPESGPGSSVNLLSRLTQRQSSVEPASKDRESSGKASQAEKAAVEPSTQLASPTAHSVDASDADMTDRNPPDPHEVIDDQKFVLDGVVYNGNPTDLKASPSNFAQSMFGQRIAAYKITLTDNRVFHIAGNSSKEKTEAFKGPSPDDVVTAAQSGNRGGTATPANESGEDKLLEHAQGRLQSLKVEATPPPTRKAIDVLEAYRNSNSKENLNLVVIGHVDAGKSTLMGRLLYDCGNVEERTLRKYKQEAAQVGKSSFALAWVLDQTEEERTRGVTMDIAMNKFETEKTCFTILDAPGHRDFVPNMIAGASQADFAVLVIDASTGAFESGFHLRGQTKEHTLLVRSMGVQRIIVVVNKLDTVSWSQERFQEIEQQITQFLTNAGFLAKNVSFVPCSGLEGINVVRKPGEGVIPWYTGSTLLEELESSKPLSRNVEGPLRLTVSDVFRGGIQNHVSVSGRIDSGYLQEGDTVLCVPSGEQAIVKTLLVEEEPAQWAIAGHNVVLHLLSIDIAHLKTGDVLCNPANPLSAVKAFTMKLLAFESLTPMMVDIHKGRLHAPGKISAMISTIDKTNGAVLKRKPRHISSGAFALVRIEVTEGAAVPIEAGNRIVLRSNGQTVAAGIVE